VHAFVGHDKKENADAIASAFQLMIRHGARSDLDEIGSR
jgi:hypothetical protein